jgi:hypothetical protein
MLSPAFLGSYGALVDSFGFHHAGRVSFARFPAEPQPSAHWPGESDDRTGIARATEAWRALRILGRRLETERAAGALISEARNGRLMALGHNGGDEQIFGAK